MVRPLRHGPELHGCRMTTVQQPTQLRQKVEDLLEEADRVVWTYPFTARAALHLVADSLAGWSEAAHAADDHAAADTLAWAAEQVRP